QAGIGLPAPWRKAKCVDAGPCVAQGGYSLNDGRDYTWGRCQERAPGPDARRDSIRYHRCMQPVIRVENLSKTYASGFQALRSVSLDIHAGEIFALLGPNGAGKTTLISVICGLVNPSEGRVLAGGHDVVRDFKAARSQIGLVPQELFTDAFESVWATVNFSRGLFGKAPDPAYVERILRALSLWDKKD